MGSVTIIDPAGELVDPTPTEIAPGRGDLRKSSVSAETWFGTLGNSRGALELVGGGVVSYARLFAEQPWIGAAIMRLLSWSVRVPLKVYRRVDEENRVRLSKAEHPLARAVVEPWEGASMAQLVQHLLGNLLVHGNGVVGVEEGPRSIRFDDLDWRTLSPVRASRRRIAGWTVREDGEERTLSADQAVHTAWWSPLGVLGISPLRMLGTTLRIEDAAQRYQKSLFERGARPPSAITVSQEFLGLDREERQALLANLRADVTTIYSGPDLAGLPAVLPPGLDWKPVGHTAVEAELIKQRLVAREEVGGVYMLPPATFGLVDNAGSSFADQRQMGYTDGLAPPLILIEFALNSQLVRGQLREDDIYVEFDFAGILRGDRLKEIEALREAIASALTTPNEGRRILNLPQSDKDGMDDFYLPRNNLWPVDVAHPDVPAGDQAALARLGNMLLQAARAGLPAPDPEEDQ